MIRHPDIQTNDIDLAAIYMTVTNLRPLIQRASGESLVTFLIPADETTRNVMLEYAAGTLELNIKQFAANRTWLYRQAREVVA